MTAELTLPSKEQLKFCLLGAGFHLCSLAEMLCRRRFPPPLVVTYPRAQHARDRALLTDPRVYRNVFAVAEELGLQLIEAETVNTSALIEDAQKQGCCAAFSLSWRQRIGSAFLDAFNARVFNLHPSLLPKDRGSGTFSYRIMNRQNEVSATIHLVDQGLDTGPVILQRASEVTDARPKPVDFLIATNEIYILLLEEFLDLVEAGEPLTLTPQDESQHTYLPLLHTETNGAIDWDWSVDEIERFVRAFSDPYPGSFTFDGDRRIVIVDAEAQDSPVPYHSYLAGRVLSLQPDGSALVIARGGLLRLKRVVADGREVAPAQGLRHTSSLQTPRSVLERARAAVLRAREMTVPRRPEPGTTHG